MGAQYPPAHPHSFPIPPLHTHPPPRPIRRDSGIALLRRDVPGAFLLRPEPGLAKRWCLWVRAPCGIVTYGLVRTHQGRFCVEVRVVHGQHMGVLGVFVLWLQGCDSCTQ